MAINRNYHRITLKNQTARLLILHPMVRRLAVICRNAEITFRGIALIAANGKPHIARRRRGGNLSGRAGATTEPLNARAARTAIHYEAERQN